MITTACKKLQYYSEIPVFKAEKLAQASLAKDGTWRQALTARALLIAQAIVSLVMVILSFVALFFAPPLALCTEGKGAAKNIFTVLIKNTGRNIIFIPLSLFLACLPFSCTKPKPKPQPQQ